MSDPYQNAMKQIDKIAKIINLDPDIKERLSEPDRVLTVAIPVKMDNGKIKVFTGFRSQYNNARGPYKGGIRYHQNVSLSEVKALSAWMTWKCSVAGIPYGGGKGGIIVNPKELSIGELERLSRGYIRAIWQFIGSDVDVPAPDVNTTSQIMAWMVDEYAKLTGKLDLAVITAKPLEIGGSQGRTEATGQGGVYVLEALAKEFKLKPSATKIAVQGFGNVGYYFALLAQKAGFKIVALSDSRGGIYSEKGFDVETVKKYKKETGKIQDFKGAKNITNDELLELPVTILVPAALESVITKDNAPKIKTKLIIEMANGPITPEADVILHDKKVLFVPDVLSNSGGVTVSYFEWVQNRMGYYWTKEEVFNKLKPIMVNAFKEGLTAARKYNIDMRMGVYSLAVQKVADAMKLKGI
ncbi:glutamate dehydrogenase [candidate division CPR3 bacterium GWF2_35_18]|uniref:Glutamate dehydrogenase n=1 Tax=candidate division CPR3 bacterium GW2011_GWF2_35_18 TaxID=1618350 RepID=A0A0G0ES38_UNCC3|nr:MAG: Glutamate dehydrogenase [candidate division CPR3 bacterium GW2011_GWF2_35_18]OGB63402.1 MAG: glutamate dehydrogenase [candidate division CPR3 bacterium GWF2_35_18]OGB64853.1 MAG: glutamate dehydrogenase [candidate division CPR3 bacterium RIFOXYA2_FULL_35_13]OGB76738.1 MAG: glutamate dehydrogenase [candidate division CPR3 bacterium RIFOXYC2_FULL_35_7]